MKISEPDSRKNLAVADQSLQSQQIKQYKQQIRVRRTAAVLISCAIVGLIVAVPLRTYYVSWQHGRELAAQNRQLQSQINALTKEKQEHNNPAWIQAQARERLLMVFPGEKPYRFEQDSKPEITEEQRKQAERDSNVWYMTLWNNLSIPH